MGSIWDLPNADGTSQTGDGERKSRGSVPTGDVRGAMLPAPVTSAGYGVKNGVPYGMTERDREAAVKRRFWLNPGAGARALAATRKALGR